MSIKQLPSGIEVRIRQDLSEGSRGDTTLIIDPIITKAGYRVTMDDIGVRGFGKIDANNPREEIISWTGITDNGTTYTLTGVVWGINFHNSAGNFTDNMKRHISGAKFSINTDMHYIADNYVNKRDFNVSDNSIGWGDGTKDENKVLEARNGTANQPFIVYNETVNKWLISNDGINTYDILAGDSGLEAGVATLINAGKIDVQVGDASGVQVVDNKINIVYQNNPGLEVNTSNELGVKIKENTGLIKDADGLWCDSIDPDNPPALPTARLEGGALDALFGDVLVVAGGGGAGYGNYGGGGGAGGLILRNNKLIEIGSHSVVIGEGGSASNPSQQRGGAGGNSSILGLTAIGGGGGGSYTYSSGRGYSGGDGGSGGGGNGDDLYSGGTGTQPSQSGESGDFGFGNNGARSSTYLGGGGGGAGSPANGVIGGDGLEIWGVEYARGGSSDSAGPVQAGGANTGNGGSHYSLLSNNEDGGSGIVIIRYLTSSAVGKTITGGTKTTNGDYTYHTFTSNGTLLVDFEQEYNQLQNLINLGQGVNNGKFKAIINGIIYDNISVDLSSVLSFDDVAQEIQSAIRNVTGADEVVELIGNKLVIFAVDNASSSILKLQPPTDGTDISGVEYLNLGANATEVARTGDYYKLVRLDKYGKIPQGVYSTIKNIDTSKKLLDTVYQNTTNKTKLIIASIGIQGAMGTQTEVRALIGESNEPDKTISRVRDGGGSQTERMTIPLTIFVPPNWYYKLASSGGYNGTPTIDDWFECDLI